MSAPLYVVDAFTDQPFAGNPAAVVVLDSRRDPAWMQSVAAEMKHSETAFVRSTGERWSLRWFTPAAEVELCGHATLAAAHALWEGGHAAAERPLRFDTASGELVCERVGDRVQMAFPALSSESGAAPEGALAALGLPDDCEVLRSTFDKVVVVSDESTVRGLAPDYAALAAVEVRGVCVTARADSEDLDFVSRFFAPRVGVPEDPVTGSAHCVLAPLWSARLGKTTLEAAQIGPRGGRLGLEVSGDRVLLRGSASLVVRGELLA